jgi:hypothetical protein
VVGCGGGLLAGPPVADHREHVIHSNYTVSIKVGRTWRVGVARSPVTDDAEDVYDIDITVTVIIARAICRAVGLGALPPVGE